MRRSMYGCLAAAAAIAVVAAGCGSSKGSSSPTTAAAGSGRWTTATTAPGSVALKASAPGMHGTRSPSATPSPPETGSASSTFADGPAAAQARIAAQNAKGGIDGRKIVLVPGRRPVQPHARPHGRPGTGADQGRVRHHRLLPLHLRRDPLPESAGRTPSRDSASTDPSGPCPQAPTCLAGVPGRHPNSGVPIRIHHRRPGAEADRRHQARWPRLRRFQFVADEHQGHPHRRREPRDQEMLREPIRAVRGRGLHCGRAGHQGRRLRRDAGSSWTAPTSP